VGLQGEQKVNNVYKNPGSFKLLKLATQIEAFVRIFYFNILIISAEPCWALSIFYKTKGFPAKYPTVTMPQPSGKKKQYFIKK